LPLKTRPRELSITDSLAPTSPVSLRRFAIRLHRRQGKLLQSIAYIQPTLAQVIEIKCRRSMKYISMPASFGWRKIRRICLHATLVGRIAAERDDEKRGKGSRLTH